MVTIDGNSLTVEDVIRVARGGVRVALSPAAAAAVVRARAYVEQKLAEGAVIYGLTTGFGKFQDVFVPPEQATRLQHNLIVSHSCALGDPLPVETVRAMLLLRVNALAKGHSGLRLETVQTLIHMLNNGVTPVVPEQGSLGASGDLALLSHMVQPMIDVGEVFYCGRRMGSREAMAAAGIPTLELQSKEGLALINGTQAMCAIGATVLHDAWNLARTADVLAAMCCEAQLGITSAFDEKVHLLRAHPGQIDAAANLRALLAGSRLTDGQGMDTGVLAQAPDMPRVIDRVMERSDSAALPVCPGLSGPSAAGVRVEVSGAAVSPAAVPGQGRGCHRGKKVQDAYSIRCAPQIHGGTREALGYVEELLGREINAATDNPLIFVEEDEVISCGNFHGQPVAIALDTLGVAAAELASVSERRIERLVNPALNEGLPAFLARGGGLNRGFIIAQYVAATLVSENKVSAHPASVDSIPSSANQEDHVSMGTTAARTARMIADNVAKVLGIELFAVCQALALRGVEKLAPATRAVYDGVRAAGVPVVEDDILMQPEIAKCEGLVASGAVVAAAEGVCGRLR
jgi:histidine ammonia-lyase